MTNNEAGFKVLDAISIVSKKLANSKLQIKRTQAFTKAEERLNSYFDTTSGGTWMLCGIISYYFDNYGGNCSFNDLSAFFDAPVMSVIAYKDDVESLLTKNYIKNISGVDEKEVGLRNEFELSTELLHCILHNEKIVITKIGTDEKRLLNMLKKIVNLIQGSEDLSVKKSKIEYLEEKYADEKLIKNIRSLIPEDINARMFFYDSCGNFLRGRIMDLDYTIECTYEEYCKFRIAKSFMDESHVLLKYDLLEFTRKDNFSDSYLELTTKAKELLLGDDAKLFMKSAKGTDIILPENIKQKELFYSAENQTEINRLKSSLEDKNFHSIRERLAEKGLPKGIAVLLYGAPGTGKTESVYQIAKETGRKIFHIDISSAKSCWFGESEKIVKRIFTDYKQMCKSARPENGEKLPILLFNEADGILSKRMDSINGSCDQTENTIQNIILEEMEKLDGIMICTTNLAENLDSAFERRFLFKIEFENPTVEAKQKIWKSKLDWLSEDTIAAVAQNYDLSGGQIDNIVRKITMDEVLTGKKPDLAGLTALCKTERLGN
ncbi:MAG: AAA family ATPase, partial [Spirochaetaceae bacterium]|nr:AAA family ATPase [Spirochaetaceae bacterium]